MRAVNAVGNGPASVAGTVTPGVAPSAATGLTAVSGNGSATLSFTPGDDGGSAVTGYEVSTDGGATWATLATAAGAGGTRTGTVTGLTNGTTYSIAVRTVNGVGNSPASDTASVTPAPVVPAAPSGFTATPGDGSVALSFVPADDGGSAVTTYQASTDGGATWTTVTTFPRPNGTRTATITGLTNGSTYAVSVRAVNAVGNGAPAPTRSVTLGPIPVKYAQLGGAASFLGALVGAEYDTPGGRGQNYERGAIYWSPATGAWSIHGYILRHYLQLGGPAGLLGYPTSDESSTGDQLGRVSTFAGAGSAAMYWTPATGAWAVHGKILTHYRGLGGPTGPLAYPVTDETGTPDHVGRFNHFTGSGGASVYWTPGTGAWSVHGAIRDHWAALGYERGVLGYPTSDESGTPDKRGPVQHLHRWPGWLHLLDSGHRSLVRPRRDPRPLGGPGLRARPARLPHQRRVRRPRRPPQHLHGRHPHLLVRHQDRAVGEAAAPRLAGGANQGRAVAVRGRCRTRPAGEAGVRPRAAAAHRLSEPRTLKL